MDWAYVNLPGSQFAFQFDGAKLFATTDDSPSSLEIT